MMVKYGRKDNNQNEIVAALEKVGCTCTDMSNAGNGVPDIYVSRAGVHYWLEIKSSTGRVRQSQLDFAAKHPPVYIVRTIEQALKAVGLN